MQITCDDHTTENYQELYQINAALKNIKAQHMTVSQQLCENLYFLYILSTHYI